MARISESDTSVSIIHNVVASDLQILYIYFSTPGRYVTELARDTCGLNFIPVLDSNDREPALCLCDTIPSPHNGLCLGKPSKHNIFYLCDMEK